MGGSSKKKKNSVSKVKRVWRLWALEYLITAPVVAPRDAKKTEQLRVDLE